MTKQIIHRIARIMPVAIITGLMVALFLVLLDFVTTLRFSFPVLVLFLPIAGLLIAAIAKLAGKNAAAGNNQVIAEIHEPRDAVPPVMAPLIL
ncbi:MAG: voltage-gated chloride channel protein, partial [Sphingobacteriales bacterium]